MQTTAGFLRDFTNYPVIGNGQEYELFCQIVSVTQWKEVEEYYKKKKKKLELEPEKRQLWNRQRRKSRYGEVEGGGVCKAGTGGVIRT